MLHLCIKVLNSKHRACVNMSLNSSHSVSGLDAIFRSYENFVQVCNRQLSLGWRVTGWQNIFRICSYTLPQKFVNVTQSSSHSHPYINTLLSESIQKFYKKSLLHFILLASMRFSKFWLLFTLWSTFLSAFDTK